MRAHHALIAVVAAIVAPLASASCYSVPSVVESEGGAGGGGDDATHNPDSSSGAGGSSGSFGSSGSSSGASSGSSSGSGGSSSGASSGDAGCKGGVLCSCSNNMDCTSGLCATSSIVGSTLNGAVGNFCTQQCCKSADCPKGTVCYASGAGGQYCVDPTWLGRSKPAAGTTLIGGSSCSTGTQCNSGLCVNGICADTCCSLASESTECAAGTICTFSAFPGKQGIDTHFAPRCAPASSAGSTQLGNLCTSNSDCQGGLCYEFGGSLGSECTQPCRNSPECGSDSYCGWDVLYGSGTDLYAACFPLGTYTAFGGSCTMDTTCASQLCNPANCSGACFSNSDCSGVTGWRCTAGIVLTFMTAGNYTVLSCGP